MVALSECSKKVTERLLLGLQMLYQQVAYVFSIHTSLVQLGNEFLLPLTRAESRVKYRGSYSAQLSLRMSCKMEDSC